MADIQVAGVQYEGRFCAKCDNEILKTDLVDVNVDADSDGEGGYHDLTTVTHVECPPDDEDAELNDEGGTGPH